MNMNAQEIRMLSLRPVNQKTTTFVKTMPQMCGCWAGETQFLSRKTLLFSKIVLTKSVIKLICGMLGVSYLVNTSFSIVMNCEVGKNITVSSSKRVK